MKAPLRILHLEGDAKAAALVHELLELEGFACGATRVDTRADFVRCVERGGFDVILADRHLSSFDGLSALKIARDRCPDVPFIFVSGTIGEAMTIEAFTSGATDYVLKERLSRIVPSVRRALRQAEEHAERRRAAALLAGERRCWR